MLPAAKKRGAGRSSQKVNAELREWQTVWGREWIAVGLRADYFI